MSGVRGMVNAKASQVEPARVEPARLESSQEQGIVSRVRGLLDGCAKREDGLGRQAAWQAVWAGSEAGDAAYVAFEG